MPGRVESVSVEPGEGQPEDEGASSRRMKGRRAGG